MGFEKAPAARCAFAGSDYHVSMRFKLTLIERHIADQRQNFDLLIHRNPLVVLLVPVQVPEDDILKGADRGEMAGREMLLLANCASPDATSSPVSKMTA